MKHLDASAPAEESAHHQDDTHFWHALVDEQAAAAFLSLTVRTLQGWRYKGGGPRCIRVSARCIRYRRCDLRDWAEGRLRTSTADLGEAM